MAAATAILTPYLAAKKPPMKTANLEKIAAIAPMIYVRVGETRMNTPVMIESTIINQSTRGITAETTGQGSRTKLNMPKLTGRVLQDPSDDGRSRDGGLAEKSPCDGNKKSPILGLADESGEYAALASSALCRSASSACLIASSRDSTPELSTGGKMISEEPTPTDVLIDCPTTETEPSEGSGADNEVEIFFV